MGKKANKIKALVCNPLYQLSHFFIAIILTMMKVQFDSIYLTVTIGLIWGTFILFVLIKIYATASKATGKLVIVANQVFVSPICIEDNVFTIINTTPIKDFSGLMTIEHVEGMVDEISQARKEINLPNIEINIPEGSPRVDNVPDQDIFKVSALNEMFAHKCRELKDILSVWGDKRAAVLDYLTDSGKRSLHLCTLDDELQISGHKFDKCYFIVAGDSFEKACLWETMKIMFPDGIVADAHATKAWVGVLGWLDNIPLLDLAVTDKIFIQKLLEMQQYEQEFLKKEESQVYKNTALNFELLQQKIEIDQLNEDIDYYERALATVRGVHMRNLMRYENQNHANISGRELIDGPKPKENLSGKWITAIFVLAIIIGAVVFAMNGGGIGG